MAVGSLIAGALLAGLVAQTPPGVNVPREYVRIELNGNPEQMLAEFLKTSRGGDVQKLLVERLKWLQMHPDELRKLIDKGGRPGLLADDPYLKELVSKFQVDQQRGLDPQSALKGVTDELLKDPRKLEELAAKIAEPAGDGKAAEPTPNETPEDARPVAPSAPPEDAFARRVAEWLEDEASVGHFAELLKKSPGFQEAMGDLVRSLKGGGDAGWMPKLGNWTGPLGLDWSLPKLPGIGELPRMAPPRLPALPRVNIPMPRVGGWSLPRLPSLGGGPTMPSAPGAPSSPWLYVALAGLVLLGVVLVARRRTTVAAVPESPAPLPPPPSEEITTRRQLRALFDRLALARLGERARPWNHLLVAQRWSEIGAEAAAVRELTELYERARYTPGDEVLPPAEQAEVRRVLADLYGATP